MQAYELLEQELAEWIGDGRHVVATSSGSSALHLAIESLNLPPGSRIIVPEFCMIAIPRAVTMAGHIPVPIDCRSDLNTSPIDLFNHDFDAVIAVHTYGRRCNIAALHEMTRKPIIEDMAEAHGLPIHPKSYAGCYSFYRNKIVAGEEGGCIAFHKDYSKTAHMARCQRSHGFTAQHDFYHLPRGINARLSNCHAELIRASLKQFKENVFARREIERWYNDRMPEQYHMPKRDAVWVYDVRVPGMREDQQTALVAQLKERGIEARHAFKPVSEQPEYQREGFKELNAYRLSREVIYLPVNPLMSYGDVARISAAFMQCLS